MDAVYNRTRHELKTYLIGCRDAVKIGRTKNVTWRLSNLQAGNPDTLTILATTSIAERELHKRFAGARIKNEWFRLTPELQNFIASCT